MNTLTEGRFHSGTSLIAVDYPAALGMANSARATPKASGSADKMIKLWDVGNGDEDRRRYKCCNVFPRLHLGPDGASAPIRSPNGEKRWPKNVACRVLPFMRASWFPIQSTGTASIAAP